MTESTNNTLIGIRQEALIHLSDSEKLVSEYGRYAENLEEMIDKLSLDITDETMESYENLKEELKTVRGKITHESSWFDELYSLMNSLPKTEDVSEEDAQLIIARYQELRNKKIAHS